MLQRYGLLGSYTRYWHKYMFGDITTSPMSTNENIKVTANLIKYTKCFRE